MSIVVYSSKKQRQTAPYCIHLMSVTQLDIIASRDASASKDSYITADIN